METGNQKDRHAPARKAGREPTPIADDRADGFDLSKGLASLLGGGGGAPAAAAGEDHGLIGGISKMLGSWGDALDAAGKQSSAIDPAKIVSQRGAADLI